jgi:anti-sigma regulatory factor (Ser/Thr protein kinase)
MSRIDLNAVTQWISAAALEHPLDLIDVVGERLGVGRATARRVVGRLVAAQWLQRTGSTRRSHFAPGLLRQVVQRYPLPGLQEDMPWSRDFAPCFALPAGVGRLVRHAFTELLNNAIDHSGGTTVTVSMRQTPSHVQLLVSDDGCGLFEHIGQAFAIEEPKLAMLELSKGKLSSQPDWHTGRGLYFTARIADVLDVHANAAAFQHRAWQANRWQPVRPATQQGTSVFVAFALDTQRSLDEVMRAHSLDGQGYGFERTVVPLQLLDDSTRVLESRAQARRVGSRLQQFRRAELDFEGIEEIGHGFADELFRVFAREHPGVELVPTHMTARVAALVASVQPMRSAR